MSEMDDIQYLDFTDENGNTETFGLVGVVEYKEDTYLVLELPEEEQDDSEEVQLVFMLVIRDEEGEDCYEPVEDDALCDTLFDIYMQQLEEKLEREEATMAELEDEDMDEEEETDGEDGED